MSERIREVTFSPAFDRRAEGYGIHGVDMRMVLRGPEGAVQFVVYTGWMLPHVEREMERRPYDDPIKFSITRPMPADIGYHSPVPQYEGQRPLERECEYTGGACYYDGSSLQAEPVFRLLVEKGSEAVWGEMERRYADLFATEDE